MLSEISDKKVTREKQNDFLDYAAANGFGDVHFKVDKATGMKAIIAIHSTKLGPALGGLRIIEYPNIVSATKDVIRLAQGMSYKAASINLPLGGGKAVIMKPKGNFDRAAYLHAFGKFVNELGGRYITALDSGSLLSDMDIIGQHTPYIASLSAYNGDPSPSTALGVFKGIQAAVAHKFGRHDLQGVHVAIQGLGHVGYVLANHLAAAGARLTVTDINPALAAKAVQEFNAVAVEPEIIHQLPCDVFSPCALGAILNDQTIPDLQAAIVAGAANNQLADNYHGQMLHDKGILYAPDYVINAGGLVFAASKYFKTSAEQTTQQINTISASLTAIFTQAIKENKPTSEIADRLAQQKLS